MRASLFLKLLLQVKLVIAVFISLNNIQIKESKQFLFQNVNDGYIESLWSFRIQGKTTIDHFMNYSCVGKYKQKSRKLAKIQSKIYSHKFLIMWFIILLCGDVGLNPGPITESITCGPSTSTGFIDRARVHNVDERYFRPDYKCHEDDSFLDESQNTTDNAVDLYSTESNVDISRTSFEKLAKNVLNHRSKREQCTTCGKEFTERAIKVHKKVCVGSQYENLGDLSINVSPTRRRKYIENNDKELGHRYSLDESHFSNSSSQNSESKCKHCGKFFKSIRGLKIHISKSHLDVHRQQIIDKYVPKLTAHCEGIVDNVCLQSEEKYNATLNCKLEHEINKWHSVFSAELNEHEFSLKVSEFSKFLADIINELPGPKHPARKFYELRKKKKQMISQNRSYKTSSNPERKSKNDRKKRKEKYEYDLIQFEYYNRRRRAVRRILGSETKPCRISLQQLYDHFHNRLGLANNKVLNRYNQIREDTSLLLNESYCKEISIDEISQAVERIPVDTTPGPDHVIMRAIKVKNIDKVLSLIFSHMHSKNIIPDCLKKARTILLDKKGDINEVANWRPVSICSVLRRAYEKILDRRLKQYVAFNDIQKGFTNKPGTYINANILNNILTDAKVKKKDCCVFILDVEKAYDNIGHDHVTKVLESLEIPSLLRQNITNLQVGNSTQIETAVGKTKVIKILRGLLQGAPLSPTLFNLSIDHILDEMSEPNISERWGYKLEDELKAVNILSFADDTVLISKGKNEMFVLYDMIVSHFEKIGLKLNTSKTKIINISNGNLTEEVFQLENTNLTSISSNESVKYLGVNFRSEIVLNKENIIKSLNNKIELLVKSPYLKSLQKFYILNNCIWPTLIYPFQCAPLPKLATGFLNDVDLIFRTAAKEVLELPNDFASSILYAPKRFKGLGVTKAYWEAHIQHINICKSLIMLNDPYIVKFQNLEIEIQECFNKLKLIMPTNLEKINSKQIRASLQNQEYENWCSLPQKGRGAALFSECPTINKKINNIEGITDSEFKDYLKMVADVAPVRGVHGRSKDGIRCRHCSTTENFVVETLPHVLGQCPFGALLRNQRHHRIRTLIANEFRKNIEVEVYEEVTAIANEGSIRRGDIIIIDKKKNSGLILDPTIRFENHKDQPKLVHEEKQSIYNPTIEYYCSKYKIQNFKVIGLFIGSRGTISNFFRVFWNNQNFEPSQLDLIATICVKTSVNILRNHLYSNN
jgi:hypothetical protein